MALRLVSARESPCLGCLREGQGKDACVRRCDRMGKWRELDVGSSAPVEIERVRLCDVPQGSSCLFRISDKHKHWRGE